MRTNYKIVVLPVAMLIAVSTFAQEKKIKRSELSAAVEKTVLEQSRERRLKGLAKRKKTAKRCTKLK
jgi:hypothetical protein